jgi:uncharacterized protein YbjT (DUF2867 family)
MTAMGVDADPAAPLRLAERHLEASGLAWNVIRPNWFMQNFHTFWRPGIVEAGAIRLPTGRAKGSFIDARDIAAVAAALLQRADLAHGAWDLTGREALDHDEVAAILTATLGRPIRYEEVPPDAMRGGLLAAGLPPAYAEGLLAILAAFAQGHAARAPPRGASRGAPCGRPLRGAAPARSPCSRSHRAPDTSPSSPPPSW